MNFFNTISFRTYLLIAVGMIAVFAAVLLLMGRVPICECGYVKLWHGIVMSSENSQHISDWYSFSHIIHGFAFYWFARLIGRRWFASPSGNSNGPLGLRLILAMLPEIAWEIFENTSFVISRYRETTISLDYFGDSVINSTGDVLFMVLGFFLAYRLPVWIILLLTAIMELAVGYYIHDNLTLNVIMLIYPFQAIKMWQLRI